MKAIEITEETIPRIVSVATTFPEWELELCLGLVFVSDAYYEDVGFEGIFTNDELHEMFEVEDGDLQGVWLTVKFKSEENRA